MTTREEETKLEREPKDPRSILNSVLLLFIIVAAGYGLPMLLVPDVLWDTIGGVGEGAADTLQSMRWAGTTLLALAFGSLLVLRQPRGQRTFVTTLAVLTAADAAALAYSAAAGEFPGEDWFVWTAAVITAVVSVLLWWVRVAARRVIA